MRRVLPTIALVVASLAASSSAGEAQQASHAGLWACEQANYTVRNLAADNWSISWMMELRTDGTLVAQGSFFGSVTGYSEPINGQGRWATTAQGVNLEFQWVLAGQQIPSKITLKTAGSQLIENGQGVAGRYSISCQRTHG